MKNYTLGILIENAQKEKTPIALQSAVYALYHFTRDMSTFTVLRATSDLSVAAFNMLDYNRTDDNKHYYEVMNDCEKLAHEMHTKMGDLIARLYDLQYDIKSYEGFNDNEEEG